MRSSTSWAGTWIGEKGISDEAEAANATEGSFPAASTRGRLAGADGPTGIGGVADAQQFRARGRSQVPVPRGSDARTVSWRKRMRGAGGGCATPAGLHVGVCKEGPDQTASAADNGSHARTRRHAPRAGTLGVGTRDLLA